MLFKQADETVIDLAICYGILLLECGKNLWRCCCCPFELHVLPISDQHELESVCQLLLHQQMTEVK
jgi:hypothetical protein